MHAKPGPGDDIEMVRCQTGNGYVGLYPAALITKLGVDHRSDRLVHVGHRKALDRTQGTGPEQFELGKAGLVGEGHAAAHGPLFRVGVRPPTGVEKF